MYHKNQRVREIVLRHGWNTMSYQILNPGFLYWFHPEKNAVIGYVTVAGYRVVAGAPICAKSDVKVVVEAFEADAKRLGKRVCYFGAQDRLVQTEHHGFNSNSAKLLVGSQPVWNPQFWQTNVLSKPSLRAQVRRAQNRGVYIEEWQHTQAENNQELHNLLLQWISKRSMPRMTFLVEPNILGTLVDRRIFVAKLEEKVVAFIIASPIPSRHGWLIEQQIRIPSTPNGTIELLIHHAMLEFASSGCTFATLGLAPLCSIQQELQPKHLPSVVLVLRLVKYVGQRYYNFAGLQAFKQKFLPDYWEPVYVLCSKSHANLRTLYAIASAFGGGRLPRFILNTVFGLKE